MPGGGFKEEMSRVETLEFIREVVSKVQDAKDQLSVVDEEILSGEDETHIQYVRHFLELAMSGLKAVL